MDDPRDDVTERSRARVGQTVKDKWRLDALLGVGGMAAVYAATHRNGSRVAVKMLHPEVSMDASIRARFLREGYATNAVGHPGVVRVLDDDVAEDGSAFLVMELLEGETLDARWERAGHRMPVGEVLGAADQILGVLAAAHEKGIVHRDLKPENVFVTTDGQVKVLDFGVARLSEALHAKATRTGTAIGTPAFMPPEQALGRSDEVTAESDVWAVGATMFTLLSGRFVHDGTTPNEQMIYAATRPAPKLADVAPVPASVAAIVDRALAFEKRDRFPGAREMQEAVRAVIARDLGSETTALAAPASMPVSRERFELGAGPAGSASASGPSVPILAVLVVLAVVGALVGVVYVAVLVRRAHPDPAPSASVPPLASGPPAASATGSSAASAPPSGSAPESPSPAPAPAVSAPAPVFAGPPAHVSFRSNMTCTVFLGSAVLGTTPLEKELPPGRYDFRCTGKTGSATQSIKATSGGKAMAFFPLPRHAKK